MASSHRASRPSNHVPAGRDLRQRRRIAARRDRYAVRHRQRALRKWPAPPIMSASAGIVRSTTFRTPSRCVHSPTSWPRRRGAIRSTICVGSSVLRARSISRRSVSTIPITALRSMTIPSIPAACATVSTSPLGQRMGPKLPARQGRGVAVHRSFLTYVAALSMSLSAMTARSRSRVDMARRLRPRRQSGSRARAVRRRRDHGYQQRAVQQHQHQTGERSSRAISATIWSHAPTSRRTRTSQSWTAMRRPAGSASRACRRSRRRSATRSLPQPASAFARCPSIPDQLRA